MLRIIAGEFRGRRLHTPGDTKSVRPLPDRVRTSLFNMLAGHYEGQAFFDAFAGSGSFGLEAISRGAARCVFIEQHRQAANLLEQNVRELGAGDRAEIVTGDALGLSALARCPRPVHVVFFDPPYPMMREPARRRLVVAQFARCIERLDDEGFAILRTPWPLRDEPDEPGGHGAEADMAVPGARGPETHAYGTTALHWYMRDDTQGE